MSYRNRYRYLLLATAAAGAIAARSAQAQSMDYGALEQLFGEPVTTSAIGKPQKASDVPADMEIITADDIRRSGADNLPDVLQWVTGINIQRQSFTTASIGINGYNIAANPTLLVLIDGREAYQDDFGWTNWDALPVRLEDIRQIEVVKGPNSALFGFNAVSGVVNIVTYDPLYDNKNVVSLSGGTQNLIEGTAIATAHIADNAGVKLTAGGFDATDFTHGPVTDFQQPQQGMVTEESKVKIGNDTEWSTSASAVDEAAYFAAPYGWATPAQYRLNSVGTRLDTETPIGSVDFNFFRNEARTDLPTVHAEFDDVLYVAQLSDLVKIGTSNTLRFNVEYRNNEADSGTSQNPDAGYFGGTAGYQDWAGGAMWNWDILSNLSSTIAGRYDDESLMKTGILLNGFTLADYNQHSEGTFAYNAGLVYKYSDLDTIRLTAARGIQTPSLAQTDIILNGNPDIRPTIVTNYALLYDRQLPDIYSVLRSSVYYLERDDIFSVGFGTQPFLTPLGIYKSDSQNIGDSEEVGASVELRGHTDSGWRWNISYAYDSISQDLDTNHGPVPTNALVFAHGVPQNTVIFGGGYTWGKWEFDLDDRWQSNYITGKGQFSFVTLPVEFITIPSNFTMTARIGYNVTNHLTVSGTAEQLNQSKEIYSTVLEVDRRFIAKVTYSF